jgi:signal transduction histidine kinase/NO-binding membrane sensor protein with MHYT domain/ActR/RegA family two-component response regulator
LLRVLTCIAGRHDLRLVLIAALVCVTAVYTAFRLFSQAQSRPAEERGPWLAFTALTAGVGVWATHFIAMLAYAPMVKSGYELWGTVESLILSIVGAGVGFSLAIAARRTLWVAAGGALVGASIGAMHFIGMQAFRPAAILIWDRGYVAASVLIGVVFSAIAVTVAKRGGRATLVASGCYGLAICGLHFTAMSAVTLLPDTTVIPPPHILSNGALAGAVAGAAALILLMASSLVAIERWSRNSALAHLREAIEPMGEGIAFFDAQDRIILWNSRYSELVDPAGTLKSGRTFRELLELNIAAGAHPDALGCEEQWLEDRLALRGRLGSDEHQNGDRWVRAERRRTREGGLVTVVMDVTDFHMATEVMAQARDAAEAANRAKSEFLATVSHELRTPLNGVLGIAEVLAQTNLDPRQREMIDTIRRSGGELEALVADIIDLARLESGRIETHREPFDLEEAVRTAAAPHRVYAARKGIAFIIETAENASEAVEGDPARLRQILGNLISNAVKFTDAGEVRIKVDRPGDDGLVRFTISDTGIGFSPEFKARIFERFQQADGSNTRRHGGTGLGLAICKQAARLLSGDLVCDSVPGRGSTFVLTLNLPRAGTAAAAAPSATESEDFDAQDLKRSVLKVLVVDDHPTNRRVVEMILDQVGAERVSVENGKEALEAYIHERFDVVLMDIQMPVMDGLTATQKIRLMEREEARPPTPVVILSANALPEHIEAGKAAGADRHLAKPISAAALLGVIAEVAGDIRAA